MFCPHHSTRSVSPFLFSSTRKRLSFALSYTCAAFTSVAYFFFFGGEGGRVGRTGERGQPKWVGVWKGTYLSKLQFGLGRASHAEERREGQGAG